MEQFILKRIRLPAPCLGGYRRFPVLFSAYELQGNHNTNQSHTGNIGDRTRMDQEQAADNRQNTLPNRHLAVDKARQTGRNAEEANNRGNDNDDDLKWRRFNEEQCRTHDEDVRHDKGGNGQTRCR